MREIKIVFSFLRGGELWLAIHSKLIIPNKTIESKQTTVCLLLLLSASNTLVLISKKRLTTPN